MQNGTVLVLDDEPKIRQLVRTYLEREGFQVFDPGSGDHAVAVAGRVQPDLVVLDLGLPDLPGEEVIRILRRFSDVPVVMLTARASEGDRVAGLKLGADDYITKPFSPRSSPGLRRSFVAPVVLEQSRPRHTLSDGSQWTWTAAKSHSMEWPSN